MLRRGFSHALAAGLTLTACAAVEPRPVRRQAELVPECWFVGTVEGAGVFRRVGSGHDAPFSMLIKGAWDGEVLTMDETFISTKGRWRRVWTIRPTGERTYEARVTTGRGSSVVQRRGGAVHMRYAARTPLVDPGFVAQFDQRLRLMPDGSVLNTAQVRKFGLPIGATTVIFQRRRRGAAPDHCA